MRWLLVLLLLLPGCVEDRTYGISGSFSAQRSDGDLEELESLGQEHGGRVLIMESFPEQFVVSGMAQKDCRDLHTALLEKDYLDSVSACAPDEEPGAYD